MGMTTWTHAQDQAILNGLRAKQSYSQIAQQLGVSKAMVSGRLFRLRKLNLEGVPPKKMVLRKNKAGSAEGERRFQQHPWHGTKMGAKTGAKTSASNGVKFRERIISKPRQINVEKPASEPLGFMYLERHQCCWPMDDEQAPGTAQMMCCAAPVADPKKREGDRRASYCPYHYALSIKPPASEKPARKKRVANVHEGH